MQTKKKKQNCVYVAFPGMGKTTYALSHPGTIDLDFGNFRSALQVKKEHEGTLILPFSRLMKYYWKDGYDVLTNDPKLIHMAKQFSKVVVVLPYDQQEHVERVKQREAQRHVNNDFPKLLEEHISEWVQDWEKIAERLNVPVKKVRYFEEAINADT